MMVGNKDMLALGGKETGSETPQRVDRVPSDPAGEPPSLRMSSRAVARRGGTFGLSGTCAVGTVYDKPCELGAVEHSG